MVEGGRGSIINFLTGKTDSEYSRLGGKMKLGKALRAIALLGPALFAQASSETSMHLRRSLQVEETYQTRVSTIDTTLAKCIAGGENASGGQVTWTEINYYYTIEASAAVDQEEEDDLESVLYMLIQTAILWCTLPTAPPIDVSGANRKLGELFKSEKCEYADPSSLDTIAVQ